MTIRSAIGAAALVSALLLAPGWAIAQVVSPTLGQATPQAGADNPDSVKDTSPVTRRGKPAHIDPAVEYARGFTDFNLGKFGKAQEDFRKALEADPKNPRILFMLGEADIGAGERAAALPLFEKALRMDPDQIVIRTEYAVTLAKLGEADKAHAQAAILKARADACQGSCPLAQDLNAALARVQASLAPAPAAATPAG